MTKLELCFSSLGVYALLVELITVTTQSRLKNTEKMKGEWERASSLSLQTSEQPVLAHLALASEAHASMGV